MLGSLLILLLFQLAGELTVRALALPVPGQVLGMVLLFAGLLFFPRLHARVRVGAQALLGNLALLFVPAGVGVMALFDELSRNGRALVAVLVLGTWVTALTTALTFTWLAGRR